MALAAFLLLSRSAQLFSAFFSLAAVPAAWALSRRAGPSGAFRPPVTVMKPLKGAEPGLYEALRSFCAQEYPVFQIIFCVSSPDDPALAVVERLRTELPGLDLEISVSPRAAGRNPKVRNLANGYSRAKHGMLLISDSDVSVDPDFLERCARRFQDSDLGLLTCFYRCVPARGPWSRLEALAINSQFLPQALVAAAMGTRFAMGAAMLARREAFDQVGGFEALADHIADDYVLGRAMGAAGWKVEHAETAVDTAAGMRSFGEFWARRVREARTIRVCRSGGYSGMILLHGFSLWALEMLLLGFRSPWAWAGPALWALKAASLWGAGRAFGKPLLSGLWAWPLAEWTTFASWVAGFGSRVVWRGQSYSLGADGGLTPRETDAPPRLVGIENL